MNHPVPTRTVAVALNVSGNRVHMWNQRRAANSFPGPVGSVLVPQFKGDKKGAPLFDLDAVLDWYEKYDPREQLRRGGAKWMPREHGTERGYQQHRSHGDWPIPKTDTCGCRAAHAKHWKEQQS